MKRIKVLSVFLVVIVLVATVQAQAPAPAAPLTLVEILTVAQGRGAGPAPPPGTEPQGGGGGRGQRRGGPAPGTVGAADPVANALNISRGPIVTQVNGTWWSNAAVLTELGLTDVQKARIQSSFDSHRQGLVSSKEALEKE